MLIIENCIEIGPVILELKAMKQDKFGGKFLKIYMPYAFNWFCCYIIEFGESPPGKHCS